MSKLAVLKAAVMVAAVSVVATGGVLVAQHAVPSHPRVALVQRAAASSPTTTTVAPVTTTTVAPASSPTTTQAPSVGALAPRTTSSTTTTAPASTTTTTAPGLVAPPYVVGMPCAQAYSTLISAGFRPIPGGSSGPVPSYCQQQPIIIQRPGMADDPTTAPGSTVTLTWNVQPVG